MLQASQLNLDLLILVLQRPLLFQQLAGWEVDRVGLALGARIIPEFVCVPVHVGGLLRPVCPDSGYLDIAEALYSPGLLLDGVVAILLLLSLFLLFLIFFVFFNVFENGQKLNTLGLHAPVPPIPLIRVKRILRPPE